MVAHRLTPRAIDFEKLAEIAHGYGAYQGVPPVRIRTVKFRHLLHILRRVLFYA